MANLQICSSGVTQIVVELNDYSSIIGLSVETYRKDDLVEVALADDDSFVEVVMRDSHESKVWYITYDSAYAGSEYFIVDDVGGVTPNNQRHLFNMISNLRE